MMLERNDWIKTERVKARILVCCDDKVASTADGVVYANQKASVVQIPVTLNEMPNTVVNCKTQQEFDDLMETYEKGGWRWFSADNATSKKNHWNDYREETCVRAQDNFQFCNRNFYQREGPKIITFDEFIDAQLRWEDLSASHTITSADDLLIQGVVSDSKAIISFNTPPTMSVLQKARTALLSKREKQLRKHGFKDDCGNWTQEAKDVYLEQLMNEDKDCFSDVIKQLEDEE